MQEVSVGIDDLCQIVVLKKEFNRIRVDHQDTSLRGLGNLKSCHKMMNVVLGVPDEKVFQKEIQLDKQLCELAIEDMIKQEAEKIFETPYFDFCITGINEDNDQKIDVNFVVGNQVEITQKIKKIAKQGLEVNVVDIYSAALKRVENFKDDLEIKGEYVVPFGLALKNTT